MMLSPCFFSLLGNQKKRSIGGNHLHSRETTVDNVCRNVLTTLDFVHRLDVPVFRGAEGPLIPLPNANLVFDIFHGENGFGGKIFSPPPKSCQSENVVSALNRLAIENEGIVLICLGPLTNIALTMKTYAEFPKHLKEIYIMGGNVRGVGNFTMTAEFNFFKDPEAAHIVLSSLTCPATILPWETCLENGLTLERFNEIGNVQTPHVWFLNEIERDLYVDEKHWTPCDAMLAATFLEGGMMKNSRNLHMTVEFHGMLTRGQRVVEHSQKKSQT